MLPSMYTCFPLVRYSPQISASLFQATMLCHSVRRCCSPARSLKTSSVASVNFATGDPLEVYLTSGSLPSLPIRMTLLIEPDIGCYYAKLSFSAQVGCEPNLQNFAGG